MNGNNGNPVDDIFDGIDIPSSESDDSEDGREVLKGVEVEGFDSRDEYLNEVAKRIEDETDWDMVCIMAGDRTNNHIGYGYIRYADETFREITGTVWTCLAHMNQHHFFTGFLSAAMEEGERRAEDDHDDE